MLHLLCSLCRRHLCDIGFTSVPSVTPCAFYIIALAAWSGILQPAHNGLPSRKETFSVGKINISFHESKALFSRKLLRECCYRQATVRPAMTMLTILMSLIRMLSDGPEVSLNGSPTIVIIYALELCNTIISQ